MAQESIGNKVGGPEDRVISAKMGTVVSGVCVDGFDPFPQNMFLGDLHSVRGSEGGGAYEDTVQYVASRYDTPKTVSFTVLPTDPLALSKEIDRIQGGVARGALDTIRLWAETGNVEQIPENVYRAFCYAYLPHLSKNALRRYDGYTGWCLASPYAISSTTPSVDYYYRYYYSNSAVVFNDSVKSQYSYTISAAQKASYYGTYNQVYVYTYQPPLPLSPSDQYTTDLSNAAMPITVGNDVLSYVDAGHTLSFFYDTTLGKYVHQIGVIRSDSLNLSNHKNIHHESTGGVPGSDHNVTRTVSFTGAYPRVLLEVSRKVLTKEESRYACKGIVSLSPGPYREGIATGSATISATVSFSWMGNAYAIPCTLYFSTVDGKEKLEIDVAAKTDYPSGWLALLETNAKRLTLDLHGITVLATETLSLDSGSKLKVVTQFALDMATLFDSTFTYKLVDMDASAFIEDHLYVSPTFLAAYGISSNSAKSQLLIGSKLGGVLVGRDFSPNLEGCFDCSDYSIDSSVLLATEVTTTTTAYTSNYTSRLASSAGGGAAMALDDSSSVLMHGSGYIHNGLVSTIGYSEVHTYYERSDTLSMPIAASIYGTHLCAHGAAFFISTDTNVPNVSNNSYQTLYPTWFSRFGLGATGALPILKGSSRAFSGSRDYHIGVSESHSTTLSYVTTEASHLVTRFCKAAYLLPSSVNTCLPNSIHAGAGGPFFQSIDTSLSYATTPPSGVEPTILGQYTHVSGHGVYSDNSVLSSSTSTGSPLLASYSSGGVALLPSGRGFAAAYGGCVLDGQQKLHSAVPPYTNSETTFLADSIETAALSFTIKYISTTPYLYGIEASVDTTSEAYLSFIESLAPASRTFYIYFCIIARDTYEIYETLIPWNSANGYYMEVVGSAKQFAGRPVTVYVSAVLRVGIGNSYYHAPPISYDTVWGVSAHGASLVVQEGRQIVAHLSGPLIGLLEDSVERTMATPSVRYLYPSFGECESYSREELGGAVLRRTHSRYAEVSSHSEDCLIVVGSSVVPSLFGEFMGAITRGVSLVISSLGTYQTGTYEQYASRIDSTRMSLLDAEEEALEESSDYPSSYASGFTLLDSIESALNAAVPEVERGLSGDIFSVFESVCISQLWANSHIYLNEILSPRLWYMLVRKGITPSFTLLPVKATPVPTGRVFAVGVE